MPNSIDDLTAVTQAKNIVRDAKVSISSGPHAIWEKATNIYEYLRTRENELTAELYASVLNPPKDEEEDDGAFFDDPVYDHFTHRNLGNNILDSGRDTGQDAGSSSESEESEGDSAPSAADGGGVR